MTQPSPFALIVTTPIRPIPTDFPPIGSLSILSYLRRHGVADVGFYNIDAKRPPYEEALARILDRAPVVLGISAVVSTAYAYTKRLARDVKAARPDTLVVVGGNLAASAEILLRRVGVDLCVIGEGEKTFLNVVQRARVTRRPADFADIPGLALLDPSGKLINTGYESTLDRREIYDIDWNDLAQDGDLDTYIRPAFDNGDCDVFGFKHDPRARLPHRRGKRIATLPSAKGCVARCTFCHRWEKGIRYIPIDLLRLRIEELVRRFNVGFLIMGDENFGTDRRWLAEFCAMIKPLDILWRVGGMRVNCVSPETIAMMQDAGCTYIAYGMETGSARMLEIMEKKTKVEDNRNAMRWTIGAGMSSPVQIVLGMPGESPDTVRETVNFCTYALTLRPDQNPNELSVNYAQALPGTPLYEFARHEGMIARDLDGEEAYLMQISDTDAHDEINTLNFTRFPTLLCQTWRPRITVEVNYAYVRKYGLDHYRRMVLADTNFFQRRKPDSGYFANPKRLVDTAALSDTLHETHGVYALDVERERFPGLLRLIKERQFGLAMICHPVLFYRLRHFLWLFVFARHVVRLGPRYAWARFMEHVLFHLDLGKTRSFAHGYRSLRKIVNIDFGPQPDDSSAAHPLRQGR